MMIIRGITDMAGVDIDVEVRDVRVDFRMSMNDESGNRFLLDRFSMTKHDALTLGRILINEANK